MSKVYKVDMNIDVSKCTPGGQFLLYQVPKEQDPKNPEAPFDPRGFKERTGAEVFSFLGMASISGANPKCSFDQLKNFRRVSDALKKASEKGEFIGNKTDIDIIKNSIRGNPHWPNSDEVYLVLDQIITRLDQAVSITENPSAV